MRTGRAIRGLRGLIAASLATMIALLSHLTGGGAMPGWVGIVLPFALSLVVCTALAGRRASLWRMSLAVGSSQFLFHALFVLGTFEAGASPSSVGHHHGGVAALPDAAASVSLVHSDAAMWGWHAVAAALTVAALSRGERVVQRLVALAREFLSWAARVVQAWSDAVLAPSARRLFARLGAMPRALPSAVLSPLQRRGPPRAVAI
jgi:hypothetical protein